jgi:hypothetical protein
MVRLYMRPIICIDVRFFPICTVGPLTMGNGIYFQRANCTQPNQPVQKVSRVAFRGRKLRKCTLSPGMASRVPIFALVQRHIREKGRGDGGYIALLFRVYHRQAFSTCERLLGAQNRLLLSLLRLKMCVCAFE